MTNTPPSALRTALVLLALSLPFAQAAPAAAQSAPEQVWLESLRTETPQAGFDLAVLLSRRAVKTIQPDVEVLKKLRPAYAHDPDSLIAASGTVAAWFATVAAANGYWLDGD